MLEGSQIHNLYKEQVVLLFQDCWNETYMMKLTVPFRILTLSFKQCFFFNMIVLKQGFPGDTSDKVPACHCRRLKKCWFDPWIRKIPWRRAWHPNPGFLPGESHGQRCLAGYGP